MRNIDEYVIDCTREDACVKVANVKSVKKGSPGRMGRERDATKSPQEHAACTKLLCR